MRTYKVELPAGVRKKFAIKLGHKVRLLNKTMLKKKTEKKDSK